MAVVGSPQSSIYLRIRIYLESGLIIPLSCRALDSEIPPVCSNFAQDLASLRRIVERCPNFRPIFAGGEGAVKSVERRIQLRKNLLPNRREFYYYPRNLEIHNESKHRERFYMVFDASASPQAERRHFSIETPPPPRVTATATISIRYCASCS